MNPEFNLICVTGASKVHPKYDHNPFPVVIVLPATVSGEPVLVYKFIKETVPEEPVALIERRMAKQLKPIDGHIAQINAPRFAEDRNMWVMMVYS